MIFLAKLQLNSMKIFIIDINIVDSNVSCILSVHFPFPSLISAMPHLLQVGKLYMQSIHVNAAVPMFTAIIIIASY